MASLNTDSSDVVAHESMDSSGAVGGINTDSSDNVAHVTTDSSDNVAHVTTDSSKVFAHVSTHSSDVVAQSCTESHDVVTHESMQSSAVLAHESTDSSVVTGPSDMITIANTDSSDVAVHTRSDSHDAFTHTSTETSNMETHGITDSTVMAAHARTESSNVIAHPITDISGVVAHVSTNSHGVAANTSTDSDVVVLANTNSTEAVVSEIIDSPGVIAHSSKNSPEIVVYPNSDPLDVGANPNKDSSDMDAHQSTDSPDVPVHPRKDSTDMVASTNTTLSNTVDHASTSSNDGSVHSNMDPENEITNNSIDSTIREENGSGDSRQVPYLIPIKNTVVATPDMAPSRRSSRKKHSTFSSDFEYYIPGGKKVEVRSELTPRSRQVEKEQEICSDKQKEDEEEEEDEEDKPLKKIIAESKKFDAGDQDKKERGAEDQNRPGKGKIKMAMKKKNLKEGIVKKIFKKKQAKKEEDESEDDAGSSEGISKKKMTSKTFNVQKRKKHGGISKVGGKKMKLEVRSAEEEEDSSDEEDSTPISQLKAQFRQKKLEELKKVNTSSSSAHSFMEKLAASNSSTITGTGRLPGSGQKRKLSSDSEDVPLKMAKSFQISKLVPALANIVKQLPSSDLGLLKKPLTQNVDVSDITHKTAESKDGPDTKSSQNVFTGSSSKKKIKAKETVLGQNSSSEKNKLLKHLSESEKTVKLTSVKKGEHKIVKKDELDPKHVKMMKLHGKIVQFDQKLIDGVRHVTKVQMIRKPDGSIIKRKVLVPEGKKTKPEDRHRNKKDSQKLPSEIEKKKSVAFGQKLKASSGNSFSITLDKTLATDVKEKPGSKAASTESMGLKSQQCVKKSSEHDKKLDLPVKKVDDLLKRGIIQKRKSHQPFGNKKLNKISGKDSQSESVRDVTVSQEQIKIKPKIHKSDGKSKDTERRKSSDVHKYGSGKSNTGDSFKSMKRKSAEAAKKKAKSSSNADKGKDKEDEEPPTLIPITSPVKPKHKHHKAEHEAPMDLTMMDLFKPDNLAHNELPKKDETKLDGKSAVQGEVGSLYSEDVKNVHSFVKPEIVYNIMIEHQYSKPSSPVMATQDAQKVVEMTTGRDTDIESISHKQMVVMDMNLPDQFLAESHEPAIKENTEDFQETCADTKEELQRLLQHRRDPGDRPSILESLDTELKESGSEFLIVGQVEVGRVPVAAVDENVCATCPSSSSKNDEFPPKTEKTTDSDTNMIKTSSVTRKPSLEKVKDSTDKRNDGNEKKTSTKDRKSSTEDKKHSTSDKKYSTEVKKSSFEDRKTNTDVKKSSSGDRKSSTDIKKFSSGDRRNSTDIKKSSSGDRKSSTDVKKSSSEDRKTSTDVKKTSSGDRKHSTDLKKSSSEYRKISTDVKKSSSEDRKNITDARSDAPDKKQKNVDAGESKQKGGKEEEEDDSGEEHKFKDDENDLDWEPNDTDTLYCICHKPHNNRFMICCDKCEEWFHGSCVGVSRNRGQEMEDKEEEYICPICSKGESSLAVTPSKSGESPSTKPKLLQRCVGRKCSKTPRPGSVYCSNECIMSHAQESLKAIRDELVRKKAVEKQPTSSSDNSKSSSSTSATKATSSSSTSAATSSNTVEVIERETGRMLTGSTAPTQKGLHRWLEQHPTFEVFQPHKHRSKGSSSKDKHSRSDRDKKSSSEKDKHTSDRDRKSDRGDGDRHQRDSTSSKDSGKRSDVERQHSSTSQRSSENPSSSSRTEDGDDRPNQIRINVRTALRDSLAARAQEADDILLSSNEIKSLAVTIEEELFDLFSDTGHKYRTKYRSLVFNIKDQKNKVLFRKILTGKIKPNKLVQMSTEELASRELAKWREQASKHQLEMIQKTEQQALKESEGSKHVRKKTHKGEVEVEEEDLSILETRLEEKKEPETIPMEEQTQVPVIDTTDQHRAHLFDMNCKVCTGKIVPGREEQATITVTEKPQTTVMPAPGPPEETTDVTLNEDKEDYEKAEEIVKEALRTMQKMEESVSSLAKIVSSSPTREEATPPLSPKLVTARRESSSSSASSVSSSSLRKKVVVRSPDSALQSGLEAKPKFTPTGPMLWKGFMSMLDVAKFFTSAYRVSGPTDHITLPDTVNILGRISPDQMWDYLSKIRQSGSKDLTVVRFIPGSDEEKMSYVHLYSYLNSRSRCGVAANPNKQIKDFYIVPLASYSKIPRTLMPFDGPGLEENRPHMLIGVLVRQRGKHAADTSDLSTAGSGKPSGQSSSVSSGTKHVNPAVNSPHTVIKNVNPAVNSPHTVTKHVNPAVNSPHTVTKRVNPAVSRDPRLAKLAMKEPSPGVSPAESSSSSSSSSASEAKPNVVEEYEPEYVPLPIKAKSSYKPVAEYIPTPTVKKKRLEKESSEVKKEERTPPVDDTPDKESKDKKYQHRHKDQHRQRDRKVEKEEQVEDDSDPYSPSKEAEPYSPGQEAEADEPYDPADEGVMSDSGIPIVSSTVVSSSTVSSSVKPTAGAAVLASPAVMGVGDGSSGGGYGDTVPGVGVSASAQRDFTDTDLSMSELVEKMARSNDPQEISSLMLMALSATNSSVEQQQLLVELTKKVEERKLRLAEAARQGATHGSRVDEIESQDSSEVSSTGVISAGASSCVPTSFHGADTTGSTSGGMSSSVPTNTVMENGAEQVVSSSSTASSSLSASLLLGVASSDESSLLGSAQLGAKYSQPLLDDIALSSVLSSTSSLTAPASARESKNTGDCVSKVIDKPTSSFSIPTAVAANTENKESQPKLPMYFEETSVQPIISSEKSQDAGKSLETAEARSGGETSVDIPDALKALMNDVMGNTKFSSLEQRRKMPLNKDVKKEAAKDEEDSNESQLHEKQAEVQKRLMDEAEALKILENVKKLGQVSSFGGAGSSVAIGAASTSSTESKSDAAGGKEESVAALPPSIDELLEKLKRGGFQFPLQKSESGDPSLPAVVGTASQPSVATSDENPSAPGQAVIPPATSTPQTYLVAPSATSSTALSSSLSSASALDMDLRQTVDLTCSSEGISSSGVTEPKATRDYSTTALPVHRDDKPFYQDRDDRLSRHAPPAPPKHPLDPYAFPPLPGDPRGYPPPSRSSLSLPQGPLHPRFPLPGSEPHISYHPTLAAILRPKSRAQPPPPGTEPEKASEILGSSSDFSTSDVDFRSRNQPQVPADRLSPPLPSQTSASGSRGHPRDHYPSQSPGDVDYRRGSSYRHPSNHHSDYRERGGGRRHHRH